MTSTKTPKSKMTAKASDIDGISKTKTQMHRRSRSGCYTCRLRRKKCDEVAPFCTACQHLGLECEYNRPIWWSNNDARRRNKEDIKIIIKRKKLAEKSAAQHQQLHHHHHHHLHRHQTSVSPPPPSLSHSMPTSVSGASDFYDHRNRSASVDSRASSHAGSSFNFNSPPSGADFVAYNSQIHPDFVYGAGYNHAGAGAGSGAGVAPYEIDIKTERQMFVNDVPTVHESHISTFSTMHTPPPPGTVLPAGSCSSFSLAADGGTWTEHVHQERRESLAEEALDLHFFDFCHGPPQESRQVRLELEDNDEELLAHFVQHVVPTIFPILEANQHGSVVSDLVLPALQSNSTYLHCCLSAAAQHVKTLDMARADADPAAAAAAAAAAASAAPAAAAAIKKEKDQEKEAGADQTTPEETEADGAIMRHRYATIWSLCDALKRDQEHHKILDATLALIFFQCIVGRPDDGLLDIAWHQHFNAAISLVHRLDLPRLVSKAPAASAAAPAPAPAPAPGPPLRRTPFNMTLTAWIDILGATMFGVSPTFAHTYREKHLSATPQLGLRELMGCEDRVMYLISEVACLESLKTGGMDEMVLCQHVSSLGEQISLTEVGADPVPRSPLHAASGALSPKQLARNLTSAFRIAARIYLCSLVPGFHPLTASPASLLDKLVGVLRVGVPAGPAGFDRSLVWVYLMGGAVSLPGGEFRRLLEERIAMLGDAAKCGAFGRMVCLMRRLWRHNDQVLLDHAGAAPSDVPPPFLHWREVMQMNGWEYLLM